MLAVQVRSWHSRDEELAACNQSIVSTAERENQPLIQMWCMKRVGFVRPGCLSQHKSKVRHGWACCSKEKAVALLAEGTQVKMVLGSSGNRCTRNSSNTCLSAGDTTVHAGC